MAAIKKYFFSFLAAVFALIFYSCGDDDTLTPVNGDYQTEQASIQNPVFPYTSKINIELVTNSNFNPSFAWNRSGASVLVLAVFTNKISVDGRSLRIRNTSDIIWLWTSDMGTGRDGQVEWLHGSDMSNGRILEGTPNYLSFDVYYYALWGFGSSGELDFSSIEYQYIYTN